MPRERKSLGLQYHRSQPVSKANQMNITRVPSGNGNVLVVDSRLVADRLGIRHDNLVQTIEKYKTQAEQAFGLFLFQTETRKRAVGATVIRYYLLTEDQATFIMSLSRNTPGFPPEPRDLTPEQARIHAQEALAAEDWLAMAAISMAMANL